MDVIQIKTMPIIDGEIAKVVGIDVVNEIVMYAIGDGEIRKVDVLDVIVTDSREELFYFNNHGVIYYHHNGDDVEALIDDSIEENAYDLACAYGDYDSDVFTSKFEADLAQYEWDFKEVRTAFENGQLVCFCRTSDTIAAFVESEPGVYKKIMHVEPTYAHFSDLFSDYYSLEDHLEDVYPEIPLFYEDDEAFFIYMV